MTLLELMIGMAVMAIVTGMAASTLLLSQRTTNRIEKSAEAIDAARLALG